MTELDPSTQRRLLDAYRSMGPSNDERERAFAALSSAIAAGAAAPAAAASKGLFKSLVVSHPLALAGVGLGVGCAIALGVWFSRAPAPRVAAAVCTAPCGSAHPSSSIALPETAAPAASANDTPAPPTSDAPEVASSTPATPRPAAGKRQVALGSDLAAEAALLHQAHSAYRRGQPAETLALLKEHAAKYPSTQLSVERGTLKVLALCALNRTDEARRIAATLPPRSTALRGTCVER